MGMHRVEAITKPATRAELIGCSILSPYYERNTLRVISKATHPDNMKTIL